jgi:hypothetical protein
MRAKRAPKTVALLKRTTNEGSQLGCRRGSAIVEVSENSLSEEAAIADWSSHAGADSNVLATPVKWSPARDGR